MGEQREALERIRQAFRSGKYEVSRHAAARLLRRGIRTDEIEEAILGAEIIEEYPEDKYGPSVLLLGFTRRGRPLHMQVAISRMRLVTVYEPDPSNGGISDPEGARNMTSKCPVCGGREESAQITFTTVVSGQLVSIERVPALVCRQCGEETFSADTLKRIEALMAARPAPSRLAEVPVYSLEAA